MLTIFSEDDATLSDPTRYTAKQAWQDTFGEPRPPLDTAMEVQDWGDCIVHIFEDQRFYMQAYDGCHFGFFNVEDLTLHKRLRGMR